MKVIISHDIDHITVLEHCCDMIIPKYIIRALIELSYRHISIPEISARMKYLLQNKWNNLDELLNFNKANNVPATFFTGVSNGVGLKYSLKDAEYWIQKLLQEGFDVGVHGIAFDSLEDIKKEKNLFYKISGKDISGIRMHYLRRSELTLEFLDKAAYLYDSSAYEMKNPYKVGNLWEFPLHIMDGYILCSNAQWQNRNLTEAKDATKRIIEEAIGKSISYFTILFHDRYFSDSFRTWKEWYVWLIDYLKGNDFQFTSYRDAIAELNGSERKQYGQIAE